MESARLAGHPGSVATATEREARPPPPGSAMRRAAAALALALVLLPGCGLARPGARGKDLAQILHRSSQRAYCYSDIGAKLHTALIVEHHMNSFITH